MNDIENNIYNAEAYWINHDKWLEGEKLGFDPGEEYVINWVESNANTFREKWSRSICSKCISNSDCGFMLKSQCDNLENNMGFEYCE